MSEYFENIHVEVDVTRAMLKGPSRPPNMSCIAWQLRTPQITAAEALSEAIRVENEREVVRGYSPAQHAL